MLDQARTGRRQADRQAGEADQANQPAKQRHRQQTRNHPPDPSEKKPRAPDTNPTPPRASKPIRRERKHTNPIRTPTGEGVISYRGP